MRKDIRLHLTAVASVQTSCLLCLNLPEHVFNFGHAPLVHLLDLHLLKLKHFVCVGLFADFVLLKPVHILKLRDSVVELEFLNEGIHLIRFRLTSTHCLQLSNHTSDHFILRTLGEQFNCLLDAAGVCCCKEGMSALSLSLALQNSATKTV